MKQIIAFVAGLVLAGGALAQDSTGLARPESVISDGQYLYVTNLGKAGGPTGKNGGGYISRLSLEGKMIEKSFVDTKLHAPRGTAIIRGALYVADIDRIVGFNLANGKKIIEINLSGHGTVLLNDLTVQDDFTLLASATDVGKIIEVNIRNGFNKAIIDVKGANGVYYDKATKRLYTCSFNFEDIKGGEVGVISWNGYTPVYEKIGDIKGAFDGLALLNDSTLIVSDWGARDHAAGFVEKIDLKTKKATRFDWPVIGGPADFYFDPLDDRLVIPALVEGRLVIQKL